MATIHRPSASSIDASPALLRLLEDLHAKSAAEAPHGNHAGALDKFVALDADKSAAVYLLLRASGARHIVEAGTSFGVSTIYLALAAGQNAGGDPGRCKVIATENEPTKAARAREHWKIAGAEVEPFIELREGDLRETLKEDLPKQIDFLLLDIWTPLALPALKNVQPRLKKGAMIVADNTVASKEGYRELLEYIDAPGNGFKSLTLPFVGGLHLIVYLGQ